MHAAFREGFEKKAFLQDLWKGKEHMLDKALKLKALNRAKNMNVTVHVGSPWAPGAHAKPNTAIPANTPTGQFIRENPSVHMPQASAIFGGGTNRRSTWPITLEHELDEAASIMKYDQKVWVANSGGELNVFKQDRLIPGKDGHAVKPTMRYEPRTLTDLRSGDLSSLRKTFMPAFRDRHYPKAHHNSSEVILEESNRVFHEAHPDARNKFIKLRAGGEAELLKRHGLRYGEEYVQPGTRRYQKLIRKLDADLSASGGDSTKLFPPKRKGPPNA